MVYFPFCKINLGLHVVARRNDGFHDIETCFYPVPWTDVLEILPSDRIQFTATGIPIPGINEHNSCLQAYKLIENEHKIPPVRCHLHKVIPAGAGLGGGSSDGAFMLAGLNEVFSLGISGAKLREFAAMLGSDSSFFLGNTPAIGSGKGEILASFNMSLKGKKLVIIKPDLHVATADAYRDVVPRQPDASLADILSHPITEWKSLLKNDFENSVFKKYPAIAELKQKLYDTGALYASMSGSGASVFGLFEKEIAMPEELSLLNHFQTTLK